MGHFGAATQGAVQAFQSAVGLPVNGVCDDVTWARLVEATWVLGERPLVLRAPHLRGDDVAELQRRLGLLGFDAGRVDGIFGESTDIALQDFQRNSGLVADGMCGPRTLRALGRLARQTGSGSGVPSLREVESLRGWSRTLDGLRIVIAHVGDLAPLVRALLQALRSEGASVLVNLDSEPSQQAAAANRYEADVFLAMVAQPGPMCEVAHYCVTGFESSGGRSLTRSIEVSFADHGLPVVHRSGTRLDALRETRMPAVQCRFGPVHAVVDQSALYVTALLSALAAWAVDPIASQD